LEIVVLLFVTTVTVLGHSHEFISSFQSPSRCSPPTTSAL